MPVTPARVSETRTRGAEACTSCRSATSSLAGAVTLRIVRALRCDQLQLPPTTAPVIKRLLRRRHEPRSIFEHIDAHVRPDVAGAHEGRRQAARRGRVLRGRDLVRARSAGGNPPRAGRSRGGQGRGRAHLRRPRGAGRRPGRRRRARICARRFREGHVRARMDALRDRLNAAPPPHTELLYPELRELFLRSGHRDEVKYSMALLGGFRRPEDADLFRIVGRHEEFTLYAAVALASVTDDPVDEWLGMLVARRGLGADGARGPDPARTRNRRWCASSSCAADWASATRSSSPTAAAWIRSSPTRRSTTSCSAGARDIIETLADVGIRRRIWRTTGTRAGPSRTFCGTSSERPRSADDRRAVAALQSYLTSGRVPLRARIGRRPLPRLRARRAASRARARALRGVPRGLTQPRRQPHGASLASTTLAPVVRGEPSDLANLVVDACHDLRTPLVGGLRLRAHDRAHGRRHRRQRDVSASR